MTFKTILSTFPSPFGVLSFQIFENTEDNDNEDRFRPLSGSYLSKFEKCQSTQISQNVSAPFRGLIFPNECEDKVFKSLKKGFRPLSGSYLSKSI